MSLSTDVIEGYLLSIRTAFWGGRGWDICDDEERHDAAVWLERTIRALQEFAETDGREQIEGTPLQQQRYDKFGAVRP
jgi:hypothetical protein